MNNLSSSAYNLYERVWLTNEIPPMDTYGLLNRQLKNNWSADLIGISKVNYEPSEYESIKTVRGTKSSNYKADYIEYINSDGDTVAAVIEKPNFEVNGLIGTELDYLTHEMHRYLFRLYPEHKNALYTLTENERLAYFQEAGYMINSSFDLSNLKVEDNEEETFYKYHKFITNVTSARKYTGSLQQEVMLLNLLGESNIVKNCDYYVTDAGTGVISNPYTGVESVDLRKRYEFLTADSFASSFSDTLFANTEDSFKFAVDASLTTESKVSAVGSILPFRETEDIYKEIKDKCDTIYKYSSGDEGDFLIPCSTDFTVSDLISEYAGTKIVKEYDTIQFVNSYDNMSAVVPMVNGEFTMDNFKALQGKRVTNAFTMGDIPSSICFQLGDLQYNKTFLQRVSLFIYQRLIKSFDDSNFSIKYTGCLREEKSSNPIPWLMTVVVTQGSGTILKGVLSKDFITKCYENVGTSYDVGTGESYNPGELTPDFVFSYLVNPKNMEAFQFGNTDFNINLTLTRFDNNPVLDSDVCDPHYGIPYVYETEEYPAFSEEWMMKGRDTEDNVKDDFWPVKDYLANTNYSVASIGDFSLVMNTVEMDYENMFKVYSNFDRYATVIMYSQEDETLNRIFFFNQIKLSAYTYSEANLSQFTEDNICDYLYEEVELANTRLLKTEGYAVDETHIKVEKDITDLIKKYGKVDFLLLNCKGDKYFGKLDQAYVQGVYCVARIDQMSKDFNLEDWIETKVYVYIWRKTNDLFEDREVATIEGEDPQESISVRPAEYNSIPYFIANVKDLTAANYKYLYDNIFSEDPSVFFSTSMKSHKLYEPTTLSKYESVLGIPGGDLNLLKVAETLINEHKSLYLDSDVYSNMVVPYVGKSVCYSGNSQALSANYNTTHLPAYAFFSNIDLEDYPDFQNLYNAAVNADEKDMGYIETTYNNHLVIWGDIVWDKNEIDNVKRLRTIWSSFLSSFVIEDLKDRFPTYSQIKSADASNPVTIRINNFNYSYNDGLPTTAYNLTIQGFKDPEVTINCSIQYLNNDSTVQTTTDVNPVLFAETDDEDYTDLSTAFKFMLPADNENLSYKESQISLSKCQLDLGTYYKVYNDSALNPKVTTDCELMVGDYKVKAISSWIEDSSFSHQTSYFASSSDVLELLAQQLVAGYIYETSGKSEVANVNFSVQDILEHYIPSSWGAVPCALYVNANNKITAVLMNVERTNESPSEKYHMVDHLFYKIHIQEFEIPSIPAVYENALGNASNTSYLYEDSDLVKTIQSILTEEGNYIPLGTDGYFKEVDIDANGKNIFSNSELYLANASVEGSKVSSQNPLYTDKKVITSDLVSYQNEASSFVLTDKRNGEVNEYSFVHNEKYFKDYEVIKFGLSLDEDGSDENAIHKDVLFQLPSGIAFEDDDNIILHNIRTPVTRSLYSLNKEIKLIDRRYNLPVSNVIAYDDSSIYLKSNNLIITDVESIIESITPTNEAHTSQPIPAGTTVTFGKHWKPSETGIGYKYYKRKFMAKGTVYADDPSRIEFDDLDITLSEHISTGDNVQVLVVTPLSKSVEQKYYILKGLTGSTDYPNWGFEMTWKLLMGEATQSRDGNGEITYDIYLAGITPTEVILFKVSLSTDESSSTTSQIKYITGATDIFNKDGKWYVVTASSYNITSKEISLTSDSTGAGLFLDNHVNEFNVASEVTTTGDTDFNNVSLETKEDYPVISPVTVCIKLSDSTTLLGDIYGRWIKETVETSGSVIYTLLNDPGFVEKQPIDSMDMTVDNFAALLGGYLPLYGIDLETATQDEVANGVIADIDDSSSNFYVDPSTLSRQAVGMYDLFGCKGAIGKTVKDAINQALLTYPAKESLTLPVYTGVMPFDVTKEVWKISQGTGKVSASNFNTIVPYLVAADIDLTHIKQASAYSVDKENDLVYIFDKTTCMVYVINYADGGCTTIPMWKWLGITHETSWDINDEYPLLTPAAVIPTREDTDRETAWNNYKTFINSLNASSLAKVADAFNQARDSNDAYKDYADFNLTDFNAWITKMENLLYLNAGQAWVEYSSCPWKPDTIKELAEDSGNVFNIAWTDILKDIVPEPEGLATFSASDITIDSYYKLADNVTYASALKSIGYVDDEGYFIDPETSAKIPYYKNTCIAYLVSAYEAYNPAKYKEWMDKQVDKDNLDLSSQVTAKGGYYKVIDGTSYANKGAHIDSNGYFVDDNKAKLTYNEVSKFEGYANDAVSAYNKNQKSLRELETGLTHVFTIYDAVSSNYSSVLFSDIFTITDYDVWLDEEKTSSKRAWKFANDSAPYIEWAVANGYARYTSDDTDDASVDEYILLSADGKAYKATSYSAASESFSSGDATYYGFSGKKSYYTGDIPTAVAARFKEMLSAYNAAALLGCSDTKQYLKLTKVEYTVDGKTKYDVCYALRGDDANVKDYLLENGMINADGIFQTAEVEEDDDDYSWATDGEVGNCIAESGYSIKGDTVTIYSGCGERDSFVREELLAMIKKALSQLKDDEANKIKARYPLITKADDDVYESTESGETYYRLKSDVVYKAYFGENQVSSDDYFLDVNKAKACTKMATCVSYVEEAIDAYNDYIESEAENSQIQNIENVAKQNVEVVTSPKNTNKQAFQLASAAATLLKGYIESFTTDEYHAGTFYFKDPATNVIFEDYGAEVQSLCEAGIKNYNNMIYYLSLASIGYDESISAKLEAIGNDTTDPEAGLKNYLMQLQIASDDDTGTLMPEFTNLTAGSLLLGEGIENVRITSLIGNRSFESKIASVQIIEDSDNNQFIIYGALLPPNDGDNTTVYQNYTADTSGYYPFAFAVNLNTKAITQIENKSKLLSAINYNDAWYGDDYNTSSVFTSDNKLSDLFGETANGSANTNSMNIPSGLIWKSGLFEEVVFTSSGIKFKNQYSSIEVADMVTGKVSKVGSDYFAFSGNELDFDNVESATVVAMVENNTKDNFQLGYGDTTLIALLPETVSVFSVNEYKYADFASVLNAYNIDTSSGGYNPIFETGDYPYISDIPQNKLLPNFYECDFDSDTQAYAPKVLTNNLGRRILPMYPITPYLGGNVIPATDLESVILNKAYSTPGSLFKVDNGTYKYLTDVNTFAAMPTSSDNATSVYSGVTMPSTVGKGYWDLEGGAGTLYKMVSDPKGALLSKCYDTFEKTFGEGSSIEAGEDYVKISGLTIKDKIGSDIETYRNENNRLNTTGATTTNTMITVESLSFKVTYKTATLPTEVPITQFTRTTSVIKTTLDEIAIPLGGYGCTIAQVGNGYFNPEYPDGISESVVTASIEAGEDDPRDANVGCRFASGLFFGKGSLTNKEGTPFRIYVGEDSNGNPVYNDTFFTSHKLAYNSFYAADSALDENLSPAWEVDAEYVLPDLYFTVNDNCKATNNIIKFTYNELKEEWGEFDYDDETTYPDIIYQMAVYGKNWSCEYFTASKTLDESSSALYKELSELINTKSASTLKTASVVNEYIGHTRRYNGSLATTIPMNLRHYDETSKTMLRSIKFTGEDATSTAQGLDPDSKLIFACSEDGVLYRIKNDPYGTVVEGGSEGDLINASAIGETETDIRLATTTKNSLSISGCSGLKISVSRVTVKRVAGGLKFVSDGNLSYLYVYDPETLASGSCAMRWVDTENNAENGDADYADFSNLSGENYNCSLTFSKDIEFTYSAQTDNEYNYIILFDKDMNVVGQIYLGIAISPKTLISYIRA